jgi:hypothetical protein
LVADSVKAPANQCKRRQLESAGLFLGGLFSPWPG